MHKSASLFTHIKREHVRLSQMPLDELFFTPVITGKMFCIFVFFFAGCFWSSEFLYANDVFLCIVKNRTFFFKSVSFFAFVRTCLWVCIKLLIRYADVLFFSYANATAFVQKPMRICIFSSVHQKKKPSFSAFFSGVVFFYTCSLYFIDAFFPTLFCKTNYN